MTQHVNNPPTFLNGYASERGSYDEMWLGDGQIQPHWQPFIQALENLGYEQLERWQQEIQRQLRENGVTYHVHSDTENQQRDWALDVIPLIISQADWQIIEAGMTQRAELLNLILTDIYGPRELIKSGLLPVELIFSHAGFLRQCDGVRLPGKYQLIIYAADLARGPDGRMWVLSDRTQAPSGAGYAVENRTVMARVLGQMFKDNKILRLANFFRDLQAALADLAAARSNSSPRVVILTPGPHNETYFEHTYLAAYLGYSLVQGDDLTVRQGYVSLKSLEGLRPVDVILRRVDDLFCDPLELREDSRLGVAGLLEAARRQNVAVVNPLGSSVLENPALMPFLPGLARHFLGEDLILPSAATWWCGQPKELDHVLANLDKLVIKKLSRQPQTRTIFGARQSKADLEILRDQIKDRPYLYVGQEQISFSTTPSLVNGHLEARHAVLRSFLVARDDGYSVMPGGLTRSATLKGDFTVSNQAGGISKDTWILTSEPQKYTSLWLQTNRTEQAFKSSYYLPSRAADNLFWVGRCAERAEDTARLLRIIFNSLIEGKSSDDEVETETLTCLLRALTHLTVTYPGFVGPGSEERLNSPVDELLSITLDGTRTGSLRHNLQAMGRAAYAVRDLWSTDTWRVIEGIDSPLYDLPHVPPIDLNTTQKQLNHLITTLMAFAGLSIESMVHEAGWFLLDIGRRLERAMLTMTLIRSTLGFKSSQPVEHQQLEAILRTTENVITYRRRYRSYLQIQTVLDLLLFDALNPRSLTYQLEKLRTHIAQLPREKIAYRLSEEERLILDASTRLSLIDTASLTEATAGSSVRENLNDFLGGLSSQLSQLSGVITQKYFTHAQVPHQLLSSSQPELPAGIDDELRPAA